MSARHRSPAALALRRFYGRPAAVGGPDEAARHYARALDLVSAGRVDPADVEPPVELVGLVERAVGAMAT